MAMARAMASASATTLLVQPSSSVKITRSSKIPSRKPQISIGISLPVSNLQPEWILSASSVKGRRGLRELVPVRVAAISGGAADFPLERSADENRELEASPTETPSPQEQEVRFRE